MNTIDKYSITKLSNAIDDAVDVSFRQMVDTVRTQCYMSQTETSWEDCDELEFLGEHPKMSTIKNAMTNDMKRVVLSALTDSDFETDTEFIKETLIDLITPLIRDTHNEQDVEDLQHMNLEELQNIHNELSVDIVDDNENRLHKNSDEYQSQFETETERLEREEEEEWISEDEIAKRNPNKFRKPNEDLLCAMEAQIEGHNVKEVTVIIDGSKFKLKGFKKPSENTIGLYQQEINDVTILALETLREQVRDANDNYNHFRVNKVLKFYKNKF